MINIYATIRDSVLKVRILLWTRRNEGSAGSSLIERDLDIEFPKCTFGYRALFRRENPTAYLCVARENAIAKKWEC